MIVKKEKDNTTKINSEIGKLRNKIKTLESQKNSLEKKQTTLLSLISTNNKKVKHSRIFNDILISVNKSLDVQKVFENAVKSMNRYIENLDNVSIYTVKGKEAVLKAYVGYSKSYIQKVSRIPYPKGFTWKAIIDGKQLYCSDTDKDKVIGPAGKKIGTKSYASMPIYINNEVLGVININSFKKNAFDKQDLILLRLIAKKVELAVKNAKYLSELQDERKKTQKYLDTSQVMMLAINLDEEVTLINKKGCEILEYREKDIIGKNWFNNFIPKKDRKEIRKIYQQLISGKSKIVEFYENLVLTKKGNEKLISWHNNPITNNNSGEIIGTLSSGIDVSKQKLTEEKFEILVESSPNGILIVDKKGRIGLTNKKTEELFGYSREELLGKQVEILLPKKHRNIHRKHTSNFFATPGNRPMGLGLDLVGLRKDGSEFPLEIGLSHIKFGGVISVLANIIDITERKNIEKALDENQRQLSALMSNLPGMVYRCVNDRKRTVKFVSDGCLDLIGYKPEELIDNNKVSYTKLIHKEDREMVWKNVQQALKENRPFELVYRIITAKGKEKWVWERGSNSGTKYKNKQILEGLITDITEQKLMEQTLRENEETLEAIIDNSTDAILVYDETGQIITFNKEAYKIFNIKKGFNNNISEFIPPEYEFSFSNLLNDTREGKTFVDYEMEKILPNGKRLSASIGLVYVAGEKGMFVETIRDISERVELRNKILDFEKAQIVSKMSEGIAHHMGTPLASMLLRIQMMKDDIVNIDIDRNFKESFKEKLNSIEKQIYYGQRVMLRLLKFASKPKGEKTLVNIPSLIQEVLEIIKPLSLKSAISVDIKLKDDVNVLGDSDMLELVLSDMCMNAIDAMHDGGKLTIEVLNDRENPGFSNILFTDTGTGIPQDILPFVFEPFYSTKAAGKGTGLGLAVAKRIIRDHGGHIYIKSTVGKGTKVIISIPTFMEVN